MTQTPVQQDLGRAKNAVQNYLIRKLLVPKIYLDADWNGTRLDLIAIDRAGVGDVHVVRLVPPQGRFIEDGAMVMIAGIVFDAVKELRSIRSQYRYVAVVSDDPETRRYEVTEPILQGALAEDGVGRVGVLYVDLTEDEPTVQVILKPERFRSSPEMVELADRFVAEHTANWEVRE